MRYSKPLVPILAHSFYTAVLTKWESHDWVNCGALQFPERHFLGKDIIEVVPLLVRKILSCPAPAITFET